VSATMQAQPTRHPARRTTTAASRAVFADAFAKATARPWDQLDIAGKTAAINALKNDMSRKKMGAVLGTTCNAIIGFAARQGITLRQHEVRRTKYLPPPKANPRFPVQPELPEETWAPIGTPVNLLDVTQGQCRWPVGADADRTCCGLPTARKSYCAEHAKVAFRGSMSVPGFPSSPQKTNQGRISRGDVRNLVRPAHAKLDGVE